MDSVGTSQVKVILSRKGFDSAAGGCPSPTIDGRCVSLPIPTSMPTKVTYADLPNQMAEMVVQLSHGKISADRPCHVDPDIDTGLFPRPIGWRGALGQVGAAQSHLSNQGVGPGDLFLFWGLFRSAERRDCWRFSGERQHRLFGWLQIGEVIHVGRDPEPTLRRFPWLSEHPHLQPGWGRDNTVYLASETLEINGHRCDAPGWGLLPSGRRLTLEGASPSHWIPPRWLHPKFGGPGMSYNPAWRWLADGTVKVASRGQEFVADVGEDCRVIEWLEEILEE